MPQLPIYLDEDTALEVDKAARESGVSRSAWVRMAIERLLANRFPRSFFEALGGWEDDRSTEEILAEIREGDIHQDRASLD